MFDQSSLMKLRSAGENCLYDGYSHASAKVAHQVNNSRTIIAFVLRQLCISDRVNRDE